MIKNIVPTTAKRNKPAGKNEFLSGEILMYLGTATPKPIINNGCKKEMFLLDKAYSLKPISVIRSLAILKIMNPKIRMKNSVPKVTM
jgi:hypothetical protein